MPFIGIIAKESDSNFIKNEVLKNSVSNKFEFININKESIENIKNIRFETIVVNDDSTILLNSSKYLEEIIKNAKYLIINSDVIQNKDLLNNKEKNLITYGLNQKATITISSIKQEKILICIQKDIKNIKDCIIEQQEFNIKMKRNSFNKICNCMVIFTILTIYGEILKKI